MQTESPHLPNEIKISWLDDPNKYPYLRESFDLFPFRSRFPLKPWRKSRISKLVGYSEISVLAEPQHDRFYRRYWWVKIDHDPYPENWPGEAVSPASIRAARPSEYCTVEE